MKTLSELYGEVIEDVFRSYSVEHRCLIKQLFLQQTWIWLQQIRQEVVQRAEGDMKRATLWQLDKMLEETK